MQHSYLLVALAHVPLVWATAACTFDRSGVPVSGFFDATPNDDATAPGSFDATGTVPFDAVVPANPPIGQWTFNAGEELLDKQGNFPELVLNGNAQVTGGGLDVNGSGTDASGWAVTGAASGLYSGPPLIDKTLVSWMTMQQLHSGGGVGHGSAITIDRESDDHFDGIVFSELQQDRWMSGSTNYSRSGDFDPGFQESTTGVEIKMAITYDDLDDMPGGDMEITGYRNGVVIGSYTSDSGSSWTSGDAEILFGKRHGNKSGGPGALDALINEARLYGSVLSVAEIGALVPDGAE